MKRNTRLLLLLAVVLILGAMVSSASAYFSSYATAKGGYVLEIGGKPTIHEDPMPGKKVVTISNAAGSQCVFVRVKALAGAAYADGLAYSGSDWIGPDADGFWRYTKEVDGDESTSQLTISIGKLPTNPSDGDSFNVIVVYESVPAVFDAAGEPDLETAWTIGNSIEEGEQ